MTIKEMVREEANSATTAKKIREMLWESKRRFWSPGLQLETQEDDPEWYEKRFMLGAQQGWPKLMHSNFPEVHMYDISLTV